MIIIIIDNNNGEFNIEQVLKLMSRMVIELMEAMRPKIF